MSRFDDVINRKNTMSTKWDNLEKVFGSKDLLPFWIADMDFAAPKEIKEVFSQRLDHGVYGYVGALEKTKSAIINWLSRRHQWNVEAGSLIFSPGVLSGITMSLDQFTQEGDGIVIQPPVYPPFAGIINNLKRRLLENSLIESETGEYQMDLPGLETIFKEERPQWLIFCNPHNPIGKVWTRSELEELAHLCARYDVSVLSDEIHADLVFGEKPYTPFALVAEPLGVTVFTGYAASKAFNLPGLTTAFWIISDPDKKQRVWSSFEKYKINETNLFGVLALETCYNQCEYWLEELLEYLKMNAYYVNEMINYHGTDMQVNFPEATYLSWLDCRSMGLTQEELKAFFIDEAKVALNDGTTFGRAGTGFMRLNFGCPRSLLREGLERIVNASRVRKGWKIK